MVHLECRIPIRECDGTLIQIVPGPPQAGFGDEVGLTNGGSNAQDFRKMPRSYIAAVDSDTLAYFSLGVLALLGFKSHKELIDALEKEYGVRPHLDAILTIYTIVQAPVEEREVED
jgi:hypothetical protein